VFIFGRLDISRAAPALPQLSPELPHEVELANPSDPRQSDFDVFSWRSFVALNWPAKSGGSPDTNQTIGGDTAPKRVWEYFIHPSNVFLEHGRKPSWQTPTDIGPRLQLTKASPTFHGSAIDALKFPVIDQDNNFVLFDMRLNKDEFDHIVSNHLYSRSGQAGDRPLSEHFVSFPSGSTNGPVGAIEIKTAWRVFPK
jgi:hypothetical protein